MNKTWRTELINTIKHRVYKQALVLQRVAKELWLIHIKGTRKDRHSHMTVTWRLGKDNTYTHFWGRL